MAKRTRKHSLILYLNDDEKYILDTKYKLSGMRSRMAFLRHLIIYGYVYDVDYKELHDYNVNLSRIGNSLNQIAGRMNATGHVYDDDVKEVKEMMKQVWHTQKSMLSKTSRNDENKAYHLIQSFLPGEVDFDTAHQIGMELADKVLEGKYSYVVSTHIDKDHIHNHVIFCAADNIEHRKYNDCKKSYYRIRQLSDELCREHHLSVIVPDGPRGKKYNEWSADRHGDSRKSELRRDINAAIKSVDTYDEFLHLLRTKGYVVKGENLDGKSPKYISFLPPGRERFVRGSVKSLGAEYTKERIAARISERVQNRGKTPTVGYAEKRLIDTSQEKSQESAGLKHWAEIENLKTAASAYSKVNSIADLEKKIDKRTASAKRNRETELILYDGAKEMLRRAKIDPRTLDINKLRAEFSQMEQKKRELRQAYQTAEKEVRQLERELDKLEQYLGAEPNTVSVQKHSKEPTR